MKKLSPVDIPLSEGVIADDGTMFVILPTLAALESFWKKHRAEFVYAAEGMPPLFGCETTFLRPYEWVFGRSSESVAHAFFRWGKTDIGVEYRNIREESPGLWLRWRRDLAVLRRDAISRGDWSEEFEDDYVSADTFGGWWQFVNLPDSCGEGSWINPAGGALEMYDPNIPLPIVERALLGSTFADWMLEPPDEIQCHDRASIHDALDYWRNERAAGRDYYGIENETDRPRQSPSREKKCENNVLSFISPTETTKKNKHPA